MPSPNPPRSLNAHHPLPLPKRPAVWLAALLALLIAAGTGLYLAESQRAHRELLRQTELRAEQRGLQLADAMAGHVQALLGGIDLALLQLRSAWRGDAEAFDPLARAVMAALPPGAASHVTVAAADGSTLYNSLGVPTVNLADREHFRVHLEGRDRQHVGAAVPSRMTDRWVFIVNRPLLKGGRFDGTMNIAVPTTFLAGRVAALALDERDVVTVVREDGGFLARSRDHERAMGRTLPANRPFLADRNAMQGAYNEVADVDGVRRLFAWKRLPQLGLVVVVGLAEDVALVPLAAGFERERLVAVALLVVALTAGAAIAWLLWRSGRWQHELAQSERRYRNLLEQAPDAIYVAHRGRFSYVNPAALRLFGATDAAQLLGEPVLDRIHPDSHAAVQERRAHMRRTGERVPPLAEKYLRLDGSAVDVEVNAAPYADAEGRGVQVIARDIGERLDAARALRRLADDLEQRVQERTAALASARDDAERANRAKSEFLSRMSHELRTPLNAILGFGQLLALELNGSEPGAAKVRQVLAAGQHLLTLINDVLDLARIEAGHLNVSNETVALQPLVADCLAMLRTQAQARGLGLSAPPTGNRHKVRADRTRLKQVLLNLLGNAVKYNREGGHVAVRIEDHGEHWRVCVDDTGPGLDEAQRARLFVPFERLDAARTGIEGAGIGLALSRRLVELMHGSIGVDSEPGRGSTFWVLLPKADDAPPPPPSMAPLPATAPPAVQASLELLCIEDNPVNMLLVQEMAALRPQWRVLPAATPGVGLELARRHVPRLILLDIHLPEMDGWSVMKVLREDPATRDIAVVAVSAHAMPSDLARGRAAGFADYLTKPIDLARMLEVLDRHARPSA
ncbi:MAG: PAS domain S-box protein [Burkholderiales bacterium]|nr:PAS domain S-box protein [Burkholderiales bacterium]